MRLLALAGVPDSAGDAISIALFAVLFAVLAIVLHGLDRV